MPRIVHARARAFIILVTRRSAYISGRRIAPETRRAKSFAQRVSLLCFFPCYSFLHCEISPQPEESKIVLTATSKAPMRALRASLARREVGVTQWNYATCFAANLRAERDKNGRGTILCSLVRNRERYLRICSMLSSLVKREGYSRSTLSRSVILKR